MWVNYFTPNYIYKTRCQAMVTHRYKGRGILSASRDKQCRFKKKFGNYCGKHKENK